LSVNSTRSRMNLTSIFILGSRIPPEVAQEIAGHNADDISTLRAMSLVSSTMRSVAIADLFSVIHFACVEDFARWLDMLSRTPRLGTVVRKVKFSDPAEPWLERHRGLVAAARLWRSDTPPIIPPMPTVRAIEWHGGLLGPFTQQVMVAYLALFPNVRELHLKYFNFESCTSLANILGVCGRLRVLSFSISFVDQSESLDETTAPTASEAARLQLCSFNLAGLQELAVTASGVKEDFLSYLVERSPPAKLKSLVFGRSMESFPCSIDVMEKLLRLGARSLVNLVLDPTLEYSWSEELVTIKSPY
jgi:hypothetical protein